MALNSPGRQCRLDHISEESRTNNSSLIVMFVFVSLIVLVNSVVVIGLIKGKETRKKLLRGLIAMYKDQNIDKYYDTTLLGNYNLRYNLFLLVGFSIYSTMHQYYQAISPLIDILFLPETNPGTLLNLKDQTNLGYHSFQPN